MSLSLGAELLREAKRQKERLEPYNEEAVQHALSALDSAWSEAASWAGAQAAENAESVFDSQKQARLVAVQHMVRRGQRVVSAYLLARLRVLSNLASSTGTFPAATRALLSGAENAFVDEYMESLEQFAATAWGGSGMLDIFSVAHPPQSLYVQIRVNVDCGLVETEFGRLHLTKNTLHFVRRADVQALLDQNLVNLVQ